MLDYTGKNFMACKKNLMGDNAAYVLPLSPTGDIKPAGSLKELHTLHKVMQPMTDHHCILTPREN